MNGTEMLVKTLLNAAGVKIDPADVERQFNSLKNELPAAIKQIQTRFIAMDQSIAGIEKALIMLHEKLDRIEGMLIELQIIPGEPNATRRDSSNHNGHSGGAGYRHSGTGSDSDSRGAD